MVQADVFMATPVVSLTSAAPFHSSESMSNRYNLSDRKPLSILAKFN